MAPFVLKSQVAAMAAGLALMYGSSAFAQSAVPVPEPAADADSGGDTGPAMPSTEAAAVASTPGSGIEEIVVTARRRAESAQSAPVSVTALSAADLERAGIKEIRDLTAAVPGINLSQSGNSNNTVFSIRGMSRGIVGNAQPAVASYVNDVPLSTQGASVPTYDISSVQVLKGAQGTLFGRNTTAGAVLITTQKPDYDLGGYLQTTVGSYNWNSYEGALNVPLVADKLALRIAGLIDRRDGYTKNQSTPGEDFDDRHANNVRVSLLYEPVEGLSNLAVYEYNGIAQNGAGIVPYQNTENQIPTLLCSYGLSDYCNIERFTERQKEAGPRKAWTSLHPLYDGTLKSLVNTTSYTFGPVTLKNIFGYRSVAIHTLTEVDGTELPMIDSEGLIDLRQISDEFQVSGNVFGDTLSYIAGVFYLNQKPDGPQRLSTQTFSPAGTPFTTTATGNSDYFHDTSKAVFGQVSYKLSGLSAALARWSIDLGVRNTKDSQSVCTAPGQSAANSPVPEADCPAAADASESDTKFSKTTYTFGINYKPIDRVLIYGVTRSGYRAGGLNTPHFGGTLTPFQSFEPETVKDYELGLKSDWSIVGMAARFNVAIYRSKYDNLQAGIPISDAPDPDHDGNSVNNPSNSTFYSNVGTATVQGIESEFTLLPIDDLELSLGGAWIDKKIDQLSIDLSQVDGADASKAGVESYAFLGSPKYSYTASARYTLPVGAELGKLSFSVRYFRISEVDYGSVHAPIGEKLDLRLDWMGILRSGFDVSLFATNLTNDEYPVGAGNSNAKLGINSASFNEPRMLGLQLRYNFGG